MYPLQLKDIDNDVFNLRKAFGDISRYASIASVFNKLESNSLREVGLTEADEDAILEWLLASKRNRKPPEKLEMLIITDSDSDEATFTTTDSFRAVINCSTPGTFITVDDARKIVGWLQRFIDWSTSHNTDKVQPALKPEDAEQTKEYVSVDLAKTVFVLGNQVFKGEQLAAMLVGHPEEVEEAQLVEEPPRKIRVEVPNDNLMLTVELIEETTPSNKNYLVGSVIAVDGKPVPSWAKLDIPCMSTYWCETIGRHLYIRSDGTACTDFPYKQPEVES